MGVLHAFVSAKSDGGDATLVRPSNWNAAHSGNSDFALLVAASDASAKQIAAADYVCDGTDDDVQIQAAIDALPDPASVQGPTWMMQPPSGGTVRLSEGTFNISTVITTRGQMSLRGVGRDSTLIQADGCSGIDFSPVPGWHQSDWWQHFEDFTLRGDFTAGKDGIHFDDGTSGAGNYATMSRVNVDRFARYGLHLEHWILGFTARDSQFSDNDDDGVFIGEGCNATRLDNCRATDNNGAGVRIQGSGGDLIYQATVMGCVFEGNRDGGLVADWVNGLTVMGSYFEDNARGNATCFDGEVHGRTSPGDGAIGRNVWLGSQSGSGVKGSIIVGNMLSGPLAHATTGVGYQIQLGVASEVAWAQGCEIAGNDFTGIVTKHINNAQSTGVVVSPSNRADHDSEVQRQDVAGSSTLNGTTGRAISHYMGSPDPYGYTVLITPTATYTGRLRVAKAGDTFTVYSTEAADAGDFDWQITRQS